MLLKTKYTFVTHRTMSGKIAYCVDRVVQCAEAHSKVYTVAVPMRYADNCKEARPRIGE